MGRAATAREQQPALFAKDPHEIIAEAMSRFEGRIVRRAALLSGGNDSTVLAHWLWHHGYIDEALHLDTGTGLYETSMFVRQFCSKYRIPLRVYHAAPGEYQRMITNIIGGFPGPAKHSLAYQRLKERPLKRYIADCKHDHPRNSKVILFTGVRRSESQRRMGTSKEIDQKGAAVWVAPFIDWIKPDLLAWRAQHDVPESEVAALLHISGECFCGAFSKPGEKQDLAWAYPRHLRWIEGLEAWARTLGIARDRWGGEPGERPDKAGPMCTDCQLRLQMDQARPARPSRPAVRVYHYGTRRPLHMSARIHTPGRTPGPQAYELHSLPYLAIDAHGAYPLARSLGAWQPDGKFKLANPLPGSSPLAALLEEHGGREQSAIDLTCPCGCPKRKMKSCGHEWGLAVWAITYPEDVHPLLTPGPIRLRNKDMRQVFERLRIVNRILVLQDDPVAKLILPGDSTHRAFGIAGVWEIEDLGRFTEILITRAADVRRMEGAWRKQGIVPGRMVQLADSDWYAPWVIAPHAVGGPTPDPVPAEELGHRFPRQARPPRRLNLAA